MEYFNLLMAYSVGTEEQSSAALKRLKEIDPEIWGDRDS